MGEKLIEAVRNEKCLYDIKHPDYVKVKLKDAIWKRIAAELDLKDGNEARKSWEKLRNNHRDALRRQKNSKRKSVSGADIRPWRYQELMAFLIPYMGNRATKTNIVEESQNDEPSQMHSDSTENERIKENEEYRTSSEESNQSSEPSSTGSSGREHKIRRHKMKTSNIPIHKSIEGHQGVARRKRKLLKTNTSNAFTMNNVKNDPLFHFFMSMYETTKTLPPLSQHAIKTNIFSLVSQEESKSLIKFSPHPHSSNS